MLQRLGIMGGSERHRAISSVVRVLAQAEVLPERADFETAFHPGHAWVRRVPKHNLWIWYRFDAEHVTLMTISDQPPVPKE